MEDVKKQLVKKLTDILEELGYKDVKIELAASQREEYGDYTTNIAMAMFANSKFKVQNSKFKMPMELATKIKNQISKMKNVERIDVVPPGFINFYLQQDYFVSQLSQLLESPEKVFSEPKSFKSQKLMVEYAHPNTHKEMHIGHMRTLITGEALSRLLEATGNRVFRANYQGDIGPHVAKALYGIQRIMEDENLSLSDLETWSNKDRARFLGRGYVRGNQDYEKAKAEIDGINRKLYELVPNSKQTQNSNDQNREDKIASSLAAPRNDDLKKLYQITREWSLDYYDEFYTGFYTKFDRLFFESETAGCGKKIVEKNVDGVFFKDEDGSIVFKGENFGLHTRVFVTGQGYSTYEGKDMCLGFKEYEAFPFDKCIHVVGNEQSGYFKVVFKALELIDSEKFKDREYHLPMGMVSIIGMKMSSRTGEFLRVDELIDSVKEKVNQLITEGKIDAENKEKVSEEIAIGAIKYSVLNVGVEQNVKFDIEKSVSLDGNSGPYLQYTYARTRSVLAKSQISNLKSRSVAKAMERRRQSYSSNLKTEDFEPEELLLLRTIHRFPEIIEESASNLAPNVLTNYLFGLAQKFNLFYQKHPILSSDNSGFRLDLTEATGIVLKNGLNLLGIKAPERM